MKIRFLLFTLFFISISCSRKEIKTTNNAYEVKNVSAKTSETQLKVNSKVVKSKSASGGHVTIFGRLSPDGILQSIYGVRSLKSDMTKIKKNTVGDHDGYFKFVILNKEKQVIHKFKKSYQSEAELCKSQNCINNLNFGFFQFGAKIISKDDEFYLKVFIENKLTFSSDLIKIWTCKEKGLACIRKAKKERGISLF